jgi:hypothetical protein
MKNQDFFYKTITGIMFTIVCFFTSQTYFKIDKYVEKTNKLESQVAVINNKLGIAKDDINPINFFSYLFINKSEEPELKEEKKCGNQLLN